MYADSRMGALKTTKRNKTLSNGNDVKVKPAQQVITHPFTAGPTMRLNEYLLRRHSAVVYMSSGYRGTKTPTY